MAVISFTVGVAMAALTGLSQAAADPPVAVAAAGPTATEGERSTGTVPETVSTTAVGPAGIDGPATDIVETTTASAVGHDATSTDTSRVPTSESTTVSITSSSAVSPTVEGAPTSSTTAERPPAGPVTVPETPSDLTATVRPTAISPSEFNRLVDAQPFTTVEFVTPALVHGTIEEDRQRINVVLVHRSRTQPMTVSPGDRRPEPVGGWAHDIGATAAVNGNWYNPFDGPAVSQGRVYGGTDHSYTALFGFTVDGELVADHHRAVNDGVDPRVWEAVSGHPTLIHRGVSTTDFGDDPTFTRRHPRTAIGVTESVDVLVLVTVDGRRGDAVGMTGAETVDLMRRLGVHDAVMLDGGGSSAMWIAGRGVVNQPADPGRAVGNQIAVFGR